MTAPDVAEENHFVIISFNDAPGGRPSSPFAELAEYFLLLSTISGGPRPDGPPCSLVRLGPRTAAHESFCHALKKIAKKNLPAKRFSLFALLS